MKKSHLLYLLLPVLFINCKKEKADEPVPGDSESLYMAFYAPGWGEKINCDLLQLNATTTDVLTAESQSTGEKFYLYVPADSSDWAQPANLKKYAIGFSSNFEFNQTLPAERGSSTRLIGIEQLSDSSYNEVTEIKYHKSDNTGAYFIIKARYKMKMKVLYSSAADAVKYVYGDYRLMVKTNKK